MIPCSISRLRLVSQTLPSCTAFYAVSVRQTQRFARGLVGSPHPASFRFAVTCNTLAFGYILPTTGRFGTCTPLENVRRPGARHGKSPRGVPRGLFPVHSSLHSSLRPACFVSAAVPMRLLIVPSAQRSGLRHTDRTKSYRWSVSW